MENRVESRQENPGLEMDLFNVSGEFEDIEIVIDEMSGQAEMNIASRRC